MDVLDLFFKKYSYKFSKGYPDMNNDQDILLLENILNELGIDIKEVKKSYSEIIKTILASGEAQGKLGPHSRPRRIKNIGNISNSDFIDIISNVFDIDAKNIKTLLPKAPGNPSSANYAFQFPIEGQEDMILVLGTEARGTAIEDYELSSLNKVIEENGGSINIKLGNIIFEDITKVEKIAGNKQADFIFIGKNNLYVQHKDTASQQLAGVKKLENNPEVKKFVEDVKQISGGTLQSGMSYKRKVESPELQLEGAYGVGDQFGIDKVQSIIFGNIKLKPSPDGKYFEILGPVQFNYPQPLTGDYELYMFATYRGYGINQQGIKNCRVAFYPKKYYSAAKSI
jgi:hypothetical protein